MLGLQNIKELLSSPKNIVITTHHKPDGDALGSSLGLAEFLSILNHKVSVISPTDFPEFINWLPGCDKVLEFTKEEEQVQCKKLIAKADLIFCLDFNRLSRINEMGELVRESKSTKIMIDHHLDPEGFEDYRYWRTSACATAELIYEFIEELEMTHLLTKDIGTNLYTGIMLDSGSFRFPNTSSNVHRIVAKLIDLGVENSKIHEQVFDNSSLNRLQFLGHCLKDKLQVFEDYNTSLISISKDELEKYNISTGDTEGIVNFALSVKGVRFAAIIIERKDMVKLSLRSKGDFPANEIAEKYFNGGGHKNAAGGNSLENLEQTTLKFIELLPVYKEQLIKK